MPFPENTVLDENLLVLIAECGGIIRSDQSYQPLASLFSLSEAQRNQPMNDGRSKWENDIQWSRRRLVDLRYIIPPEKVGKKSFYRGLWRLTESGHKEAERLTKTFQELWMTRLKEAAAPIKKEDDDFLV